MAAWASAAFSSGNVWPIYGLIRVLAGELSEDAAREPDPLLVAEPDQIEAEHADVAAPGFLGVDQGKAAARGTVRREPAAGRGDLKRLTPPLSARAVGHDPWPGGHSTALTTRPAHPGSL